MAAPAIAAPTPRSVLADIGALVAELRDLDWAGATDDELVDLVTQAGALRSALHAAEAQLLCEVDDRDFPRRRLGWGSTADWYTHAAGLRRGLGKRIVDHARELVRERSATLAALSDGSVSPEQADVVLDAVDRLPGSAQLRDQAEQMLLQQAAQLDATDLRKAARHIVEVVDPDCTERIREEQLDREDRMAHLRRFFSITDDGAGGVRVKGRGSVEDAAILRTALLPLTAPQPHQAPAAENCAQLPDPRDFGVRMWDALVRLAQHFLDTEAAPESHGARPRVVITTKLETLKGALATRGCTDDGLELAPSVVRRLACDAEIIPAVLGTEGQVLDVGRAHRLVTPALWVALVLRDHHCAFPGCTRPPVMCHAHHIRPWSEGGPTSLDNLVLLCGHHHRLLHSSHWQVRIACEDRRPEFQPPPKGAPGMGRPEWLRSPPRRQ